MLLTAILQQAGFRVLSAPCACEGLELATRQNFDAVVMDYDLPDMTGAQLAQEIRAFAPSAKIILLSGRPELTPGELAYVDIHVVKGSLTERLIETIYTLIDTEHLSTATAQGCYYA